jgi:hypothetical protein
MRVQKKYFAGSFQFYISDPKLYNRKVRKVRYAKAAFSKTVTRFWKISSFVSYPWQSSRLERVYERAVTPSECLPFCSCLWKDVRMFKLRISQLCERYQSETIDLLSRYSGSICRYSL